MFFFLCLGDSQSCCGHLFHQVVCLRASMSPQVRGCIAGPIIMEEVLEVRWVVQQKTVDVINQRTKTAAVSLWGGC